MTYADIISRVASRHSSGSQCRPPADGASLIGTFDSWPLSYRLLAVGAWKCEQPYDRREYLSVTLAYPEASPTSGPSVGFSSAFPEYTPRAPAPACHQGMGAFAVTLSH